MKDNLTDFERAEYYKEMYDQAMKSRAGAIIIFSVISMLIGFFIGADII